MNIDQFGWGEFFKEQEQVLLDIWGEEVKIIDKRK